MIQTIRVKTKIGPDLKGNGLLSDIKHYLKIHVVEKIETAIVYRLERVTQKQAMFLAKKLFCEEINQEFTLNKSIISNAKSIVEIAYKPGVMNPQVASIIKSARDLGINLVAADTSTEYGFYGTVSKKEVENILRSLHVLNEIVEHIVFEEPKTLLISGTSGKTKIIPIRKMKDNELVELSHDKLFLNLEEMKVIQGYFLNLKRDPSDCELEVLAQTWSEHCGHKTFKAKLIVDGKVKQPLIDRIKKTADFNKDLIVSAFSDNSGIIDFYDGFGICGKVETHNSPSAIEPYGGAMTGSGGVFRDILGTGQGAKISVSTDIFCFAPPDLPDSKLPPGCLPPLYILRRVIAGVKDYGNRVGIPTNNGSLHFHEDFRAKPTVAVGSFGFIPKKNAKKKSLKIGDLAVTIGGRTGRDGIHGATFSSGEMTDRTINVSGSAVQIGNAIEEKRVIDAVLALREKGFIRAITDCGAGGFSSAIGEMGKETGVQVFLEKAPLKYPGLAPWEIFLSESQERMVIAIDPKDLKQVLEILKLHNVESAVIGKFDRSKRLRVYYKKTLVCNIDMKFLHDGLPQRTMKATSNEKQKIRNNDISVSTPSNETQWTEVLKKVLSHGNVCSKEPIIRLYDHNVQGSTALHAFAGENYDGPNDGSIIKPLLKKKYGLAVTHGLNPILNRIDPFHGSVWAITEAVSNYVSIGGMLENAALIDNFIWPFPDEESLYDLDQAVDACVTMAKLLKMPFVSGKDSLSSTYRYPNGNILKIPPVLLVSVFGKIPDVTKTATSDFKKNGSTIVLIGNLDTQNLGGSVYYDTNGILGNLIPHINTKDLPKIFNTIYKEIQSGQILSCHDISEGGTITSLFEMSLGGNVGIDISIPKQCRSDYFLFNETAGTFLVEVENDKVAKKLFKNIPYIILGKTKKEKSLSVQNLFDVKIKQLEKSWKKPMKEIFG